MKKKRQPNIDTKQCTGKRTHQVLIMLLGRPRCAHCVRLASTRLPVGKQGHIVALRKGIDRLVEVIPNTILHHLGAENAIKHKQLAARG